MKPRLIFRLFIFGFQPVVFGRFQTASAESQQPKANSQSKDRNHSNLLSKIFHAVIIINKQKTDNNKKQSNTRYFAKHEAETEKIKRSL